MMLDYAATVKLNRQQWCFEVSKTRIPSAQGMAEGRHQGTTKQGSIAKWLSWDDKTCKLYDSGLARLCLKDAVSSVPDKSGIYWCWEFCKHFITECNKIGEHATIQHMADTEIRLRVRDHLVYMTVLDLWKELEDNWRDRVRPLQQYNDQGSGAFAS